MTGAAAAGDLASVGCSALDSPFAAESVSAVLTACGIDPSASDVAPSSSVAVRDVPCLFVSD